MKPLFLGLCSILLLADPNSRQTAVLWQLVEATLVELAELAQREGLRPLWRIPSSVAPPLPQRLSIPMPISCLGSPSWLLRLPLRLPLGSHCLLLRLPRHHLCLRHRR